MKSEGRCHSNCEQKFGTVHTPMHPANVPEGKRFSRRRSRVCGWGECWHFHCWCEDVNYAKIDWYDWMKHTHRLWFGPIPSIIC